MDALLSFRVSGPAGDVSPLRDTPLASPVRLPRRSPPQFASAHMEVVREGCPARGAFIIISGAVLLSRTTEDGKRHVLALLGAGDVFGLPSGPAYEDTVETLCLTQYEAFDVPACHASADGQASLSGHLLKQLHASRSHMVLLQRRSAEEKIAALILGLPVADPARDADRRIMLTLTDAADYLSLRMETVSRVLSRFRKQGLIASPRRGRVVILAEAALTAIAHPSD